MPAKGIKIGKDASLSILKDRVMRANSSFPARSAEKRRKERAWGSKQRPGKHKGRSIERPLGVLAERLS
jgi:hypothetical protein